MDDKQASFLNKRGEMMNAYSLGKKPMTKMCLPAVTFTLILVILILGCHRKINENSNPYFVNQGKQNIAISERDLNKFRSSVKVIDGQAESHYKMALFFQSQKKHQLAIEELKKAVRLNHLFAKAYDAMGISYDSLGHYNQAINCYQRALKLDPKLDFVHNNLGYSYLLKNELDAAIAAFQKAIELNNNNKRYRNNLGLAYVMKDQYDKAYEQFKIVEDDAKAKEKLAGLLDQLGKEKPDQYFAKDFYFEHSRKPSNREKPLVIRRKIDAPIPQSLIEADVAAPNQKDQEKENLLSSYKDKEANSNPEKNKELPDETETNTVYSHSALVKNPEGADPNKVKSSESIEKENYREFQDESNRSDRPVPCEFCKEDTAESTLEAIRTNQVQTIAEKNQTLADEKNNEIYTVDEPSASPDSAYYPSTAELASEPASDKTVSTESVKAIRPAYENSNDAPNTVALKVIESEEAYYPNVKETASATPVNLIQVKEYLIESNQTVSKKRKPSVLAQAASFAQSKEQKQDYKISQNLQAQRKEALSLDVNETNLNENIRSEESIARVEIEVANGNGINGTAGRFGSYLKLYGFKVAKVSNANSFDHARTKIFYCKGDKKNVDKLLRQIPFVLDQQSIIELKNPKNRIKIIIGKDLVKHDVQISSIIYNKRKS